MEISSLDLAGAGATFILVAIASYFTGHHNGLHRSATNRGKPTSQKPGGQFDPAFILQNMDDGVAIVDETGIIRLINPAAAALSGWKVEEAAGLDVNRVLTLVDEHGKPYEDGQRPFLRAIASAQAIHSNKSTLVSRSQRHIPLSLVISPISPAAGGGAIGVFRDITKEKEEEGARMEFISTASHEMRTPIAAIEGYLSLVINAKNAMLDQNSRIFLEKAHQSTKHLGQLFQDLLSTTRAEDSRLDNHPEQVNVSDLLRGIISEMESSAKAKKLSLHFLSEGEESARSKVLSPLFYVKADPERLKEVFRNLLDNDIKYTAAGGVTIKLTGDESIVQAQIIDTGIGIPTEDVPHLFQKFYRVDSSLTRQVGGTGLGLFICKKILDLYNGRVWVESKLGRGSTFFVNLPRSTPTQPVASQAPTPVIQSIHQA